MKKIIAPLAIAIMAVSVSSCDFFRALAGRPTSDQFQRSESCCEEAADTNCCAAVDSTCCKADSTVCCHSDSTVCCHSDSVCCGSCGLVDSLADQVVKEAAALADSIKLAADSLASEIAAASAELGADLSEAAQEVAAEMSAAASEIASEMAAAAQEIAAEMTAASEDLIVNTLSQKTGFLQIGVRYNSDPLVKEVLPGYYILVGTFSVKANADRIEKLARNAGLNPVRLEYASGKTAVGVLRTTEINEAFVSLAQVRKYGFAPKDACILVVE